MRSLPILTLAAALLGTGIAHAQPAQVITIPGAWYVTDITPDGTVVVGAMLGGGGFIWRWQEDATPTNIGAMEARAVSDDGSVILGNMDDGTGKQVAGLWTAADGWQSLGGFDSCDAYLTSAYDLSGDGTTAVGLAWDGCNGRGFIWTEATGMQYLEELGNGVNRASTISSDGSIIGGFAQGSFSRTPAYWYPDTTGEMIDFDDLGEVYSFTDDGSISVGIYYGNAFYRTADGTLTSIGKLNPGPAWEGHAFGISEDAQTIVGLDVNGVAKQGWIWTPGGGIENLRDHLVALGATDVPVLDAAHGVSNDGNVIIGNSDNPFDPVPFIAMRVGLLGTWTQVGNGLAGAQGVPSLEGAGTLVGGTNASMELTGGLPFGSAALVLGLSQINAAFKQGVLVPSPDVIIPGLPLDGAGSLALQLTWPTGLPSEASLYWQYWITDPAGPAGFAASNGLQSTTP